MIPPEIRIELDKLLWRLENLERANRGSITQKEAEKIAKEQVDSLRPELDALKRRAG